VEPARAAVDARRVDDHGGTNRLDIVAGYEVRHRRSPR